MSEDPKRKRRPRTRTLFEAGGVVVGLLVAYFTRDSMAFHDTVTACGYAALCAIAGALVGSAVCGWIYGKAQAPATDKKGGDKQAAAADEGHFKAIRETAESIVIAFILAFLFRAFEAEAFVIPTGSMAPTLMGRHKDVVCPQSRVPYRAGASSENEEHGNNRELVIGTRGPFHRYTMPVEHKFDRRIGLWRPKDSLLRSFSGDRIIVSKYIYEFAPPKRWDVIVFKYPNNAKQNYIKRLVGLPGETIRIRHGDLFVRGPGDSDFAIARKTPGKLKAMLQRVDDTRYLPQAIIDADWPRRWQPWQPPGSTPVNGWEALEGGREFRISHDADASEDGKIAWLRYRHLVPMPADWYDILGQEVPAEMPSCWVDGRPAEERPGELISDYYAYNDIIKVPFLRLHPLGGWDPNNVFLCPEPGNAGVHWVGDLALEADLKVESDKGYLWLQLVEGGRFYRCRIDVATGEATLSIDDGGVPFVRPDGTPGATELVAKTRVRGAGSYRLRLANCDDRLFLWVNDRLQQFRDRKTDQQAQADYANDPHCRPVYSPAEPADLMPAGLGSQAVSLHIKRLRVFRDIYYIADKSSGSGYWDLLNDYGNHLSVYDDVVEVLRVFRTPEQWETTPWFGWRGQEDFPLEEDQFFPLGDNSPQSKDGRLWTPHRFVQRRYLTGKALFIYWPHSWDRPVPFFPNFQRMGFVR
jgi:signal peptidase I